MRQTFATVLFAVIALCVGSAPGRADETLAPSWMKIDEASKIVGIQLVAGWNANNSALNFNGYYKGDMTIVVPVDWTVDVKFSNHDGMLPHSMVITKPFDDHIPEQAGLNELAINRAYSVDLESGIMSNQHDEIRFSTRETGKYWMLCGVTGHALQGMWVGFEVDAKAEKPHIIVASGAEVGWR
jgi:sulfocyanin